MAVKYGKIRLGADRRAGLVAQIEMPEIHAIAKHCARIVLSRGERYRTVSIERLRAFDPEAVELAGFGHSAHVEAPEPFWRRLATATGL